MAKFRRNHERKSNPFAGLTLKVLLIFGILTLLWIGVNGFFNSQKVKEALGDFDSGIERDYLPSSDYDLQVVHHKYYSLGYYEKEEIPLWVSYILTKEDLQVPNVKRWRDFLSDPEVITQSAHYKDYTNSGYTRGHLAPAGDMAFSKEAMKESFYMSNITPQRRQFNNGIWKELEESVRDWGYTNSQLYITTGPVPSSLKGRIGRNNVGTPQKFYKAILDYSGREKKAIGFIMPNKKCDEPISHFAMSIDELERAIGLNVFSNVYNDEEDEYRIESSYDIGKWKLSKKRYRLRVDKWNNQ